MSETRPPWEFEEPRCAEVGTEIFFAKDKDEPGSSKLSANEYEMARKICQKCPHKMECAEWGILNEVHGVWGGLTPQQRSRLRKQRRIQVPITVKTNY